MQTQILSDAFDVPLLSLLRWKLPSAHSTAFSAVLYYGNSIQPRRWYPKSAFNSHWNKLRSYGGERSARKKKAWEMESEKCLSTRRPSLLTRRGDTCEITWAICHQENRTHLKTQVSSISPNVENNFKIWLRTFFFPNIDKFSTKITPEFRMKRQGSNSELLDIVWMQINPCARFKEVKKCVCRMRK